MATKMALVLTQLKTWDDWRAVQKFSWGPLSKILAVNMNVLLYLGDETDASPITDQNPNSL